ncbi:3-ketoacyl-CoA thiolase 2 [Nymphaea thermarum]|nr:3-ketoacyl-CoA thiolase 2 [Nymphaea thermarum]
MGSRMELASVCLAGDSAPYHRTAAFGDDIVVVAAYRTAICKAKRGGFKDTHPEDLLASVLKANSHTQAADCLLPMGITSENVAHRYGVTRQEQDQASVESHRRAAEATALGKFKDEIVPVHTKIIDPKTGEEKSVIISVDDGIRPDTSLSILAKLKPAFKKDGSTTAGNSSQVSDGAGGVLLMKRSLALQKGLPILGVFRSFVATGVDPAVMGIGPAVAIPAAVKAAGLEVNDIDLFEINEVAFASQYVYCCKKLELDPEKVNVNGGAIAFGHPLGATGARCVATLLHEMKRRGKDCKFGVVSMCIGTGMGAAAVFERGDCVDQLCNARKMQANKWNLLSKDVL